jgi:hypothetical protein
VYLIFLVATLLTVSQIPHSVEAVCGCSSLVTRRSATGSDETTQVGDMIFGNKDRLRFSSNLKKFRMGTNMEFGFDTWPNGVVPYFVSGLADQKDLIRNSLILLSNATQNCVTFVELQSDPNGVGNYVQVYDGGWGQCNSKIAMWGGMQTLSLGSGCWLQNTIQHEFIHALGFYHEHNMPDRAQYIKLIPENIDKSNCDSFAVCSSCTAYAPYNVNSIMHYSSTAFTCQAGANTMLKVDGSTLPISNSLQQTDISAIRKFYQCS